MFHVGLQCFLFCFFKWDFGSLANILSCSHPISAWFVYGLDPHATYHYKQLHAGSRSHTPRACLWSWIHKVRLTLKWLTHKCAHASGPTEGNSGHTLTPPPVWLAPLPARPHQPSANRRVNIATSCRGGDANQCHPAPGPEWPHKSLFSSLLFSKSTDPGHFRTAIHLNKWHWAVYYLASRHAVTEGGAWQTSKEKQAFHHSFACSLVSYTFPSNASLSLASCFCFLFFPPLLVSLCHQNCCKKLDLSLYDYRGLHNDAEQGFQGKHR